MSIDPKVAALHTPSPKTPTPERDTATEPVSSTLEGGSRSGTITPVPATGGRMRTYTFNDNGDVTRTSEVEFTQPPVPPAATGERDAKDYAVEFGGYLAQAAENFLVACDARPKPDAPIDVDAWKALNSAIYEFRKRRDRVLAVSFPIQQEWQPMETAPKDGTHFLACTATVFLGELWWEPTEPQYDSGWFDGQWHYKPSYWMPLLRLPIQQDADDIEGNTP